MAHPYRSPKNVDSRSSRKSSRQKVSALVFVPIVWFVVLVLGLPAMHPVSLGAKVLLTLLTLGALYALVHSVRAWWYVLTAPLWLALIWMVLEMWES